MIRGLFSRKETAQTAAQGQTGAAVVPAPPQITPPPAGGSTSASTPSPLSSRRPTSYSGAVLSPRATPAPSSRPSVASIAPPAPIPSATSPPPTSPPASLAAVMERLERLELSTQSHGEALDQALQRVIPEELAKQLGQQKEEVAEQLRSLSDEVVKLQEEVVKLHQENGHLRHQLSELTQQMQKLVDLVEPARRLLTRKDASGTIDRLEEDIVELMQAKEDAKYIQRLLLHLLQGDLARALHEVSLEYYAALPAYLHRLCDVDLADVENKADVSRAAADWGALVDAARTARDSWLALEHRQNRFPSAVTQEAQLELFIMQQLRSNDSLRTFFKARGVDKWALMLWTAARRIKHKPFGDIRHEATHIKPSANTAVAVLSPFLSTFGYASPALDTSLSTLVEGLRAVTVRPIGGEERMAFAAEGVLQSENQEDFEKRVRDVFVFAREWWADGD